MSGIASEDLRRDTLKPLKLSEANFSTSIDRPELVEQIEEFNRLIELYNEAEQINIPVKGKKKDQEVNLQVIEVKPQETRSDNFVIMCPGRAEAAFIYLRYAKRIADELGCSVFIVDHRGHGASDRPIGKKTRTSNDIDNWVRGYIDSFKEYTDDFKTVIDYILERNANSNSKVTVIGHSMGGLIGLSTLGQLDRSPNGDNPSKDYSRINKLVLLSPLLEPNLGDFPKWAVKAISLGAYCFGQGHRYCFNKKSPDNSIIGPNVTSDKISQIILGLFIKSNPEHSVNGPTFGWLRAVLKELDKLKNPILHFKGLKGLEVLVKEVAEDTIVKPKGKKAWVIFAEKCGFKVTHELIEGRIGHTLLWEKQEIRARVVDDIINFISVKQNE